MLIGVVVINSGVAYFLLQRYTFFLKNVYFLKKKCYSECFSCVLIFKFSFFIYLCIGFIFNLIFSCEYFCRVPFRISFLHYGIGNIIYYAFPSAMDRLASI